MNDLEETLYRYLRGATHHGQSYVEIPSDLIARLGLPDPSVEERSRADIAVAVSGSIRPGEQASDIPLICGEAMRTGNDIDEWWCLWWPAHDGDHGWVPGARPPE